MPHLSGPRRYFFHHSYRVLSLLNYPSLAGKTVGTRIEKYRPLIMPLRLRGSYATKRHAFSYFTHKGSRTSKTSELVRE